MKIKKFLPAPAPVPAAPKDYSSAKGYAANALKVTVTGISAVIVGTAVAACIISPGILVFGAAAAAFAAVIASNLITDALTKRLRASAQKPIKKEHCNYNTERTRITNKLNNLEKMHFLNANTASEKNEPSKPTPVSSTTAVGGILLPITETTEDCSRSTMATSGP